MQLFKFTLLFIFLSLISCKDRLTSNSDDKDNNDSKCPNNIILNEEIFINTKTDDYQIVDVRIEDNCLLIDFHYSGGCGEIKYQLIAKEIYNQYQNYHELRFILEDNDPCEAWLFKTSSFNISSLKNKDNNSINLKLENFSSIINYTYIE